MSKTLLHIIHRYTHKKLCKIDVSISIGVKDLEDMLLEHLDVGGGLGVAARQVLDLVLLQPVRPVHLVAVAVPELTNSSYTFIIYLLTNMYT